MKARTCIITLVVVVTITILPGCGQLYEEDKHQGIESGIIYDYCVSHNITPVDTEPAEDTTILAYRKGKEYGTMVFSLDADTNNVNVVKSLARTDDGADKVDFFQVNHGEYNYIVVFLLEEEIKQKATAVTVEFQDNTSPSGITTTTISNNEAVLINDAVIIRYHNDTGLRNIYSIAVEDVNGNEIYVSENINRSE